MEWLRSAACVGEDPELFFPVGTSGPALRDVAAAKQVCSHCPVTGECLDWALAGAQEMSWGTSGIWGGLSEKERDAMMRATGRRGVKDQPARAEG
jgi:WhiB family transcriptional regulator, redox-sensing transcriptional regulator